MTGVKELGRLCKLLSLIVFGWALLSIGQAQGADIEVDFQRRVGEVRLGYGTNEFRDLMEDGSAQRRSREVNTRYVRMWIDQWFNRSFAPDAETRHWFYVENFVRDALHAGKDRGAIPVLCFASAPAWMNRRDDWSGRGHPRSFQEFADYVVAVVSHIQDEMNTPIAGWMVEIWNEPNNREVSGPWDKSAYFEMFNTVARELRDRFGSDIEIGGPGTDGSPEDWITGFLDACGDLSDFVSFHKYPQWDSRRSDEEVMRATVEYRHDGERVEGWVRDRGHEGMMVLLGELNFDANYNPPNPKIWEPITAAWYASVLNHLVLSPVDVEMFFRGSDKHGNKEFGLWNWEDVSYAFHGKRLFTTAVRPGNALAEVTKNSGDWRIEAIATKDLRTLEKSLILIHKDPRSGARTYSLSGVEEGFRAFVVDGSQNGEIHEMVGFQGDSITLEGPAVVAITNYDLLSSWNPEGVRIRPRAGHSVVDDVVIIESTYHDREGAYDIERANIWADIEPPSRATVPQSFHGQVRNVDGQFKYYGYDAEAGEWTVGGFDPGTDGEWICIDGDGIDRPCLDDSTTPIAAWRVRRVSTSGEYLYVTWEIQFGDFFSGRVGDRGALEVYTYAKDREGNGQQGGWKHQGFWIVCSSPTCLRNPSFEVDEVGPLSWMQSPTYWTLAPGGKYARLEIVDSPVADGFKSLRVETDPANRNWYQGIEQTVDSPGPEVGLTLSGYAHVERGTAVVNVFMYRLPLEIEVLGYAVIHENRGLEPFSVSFTTLPEGVRNTGNIHIRVEGTENRPWLGGTQFTVDGLAMSE